MSEGKFKIDVYDQDTTLLFEYRGDVVPVKGDQLFDLSASRVRRLKVKRRTIFPTNPYIFDIYTEEIDV